MALVRPRLNDYHGLAFTQEEADFAIPFLDDDIPLYVDPFLLWKSPSMQDQALHTALVSSFNHLGHLAQTGREKEAVAALIRISGARKPVWVRPATKGNESRRNKRFSCFSVRSADQKGGFGHIEKSTVR
jgi:hypothetical protein